SDPFRATRIIFSVRESKTASNFCPFAYRINMFFSPSRSIFQQILSSCKCLMYQCLGSRNPTLFTIVMNQSGLSGEDSVNGLKQGVGTKGLLKKGCASSQYPALNHRTFGIARAVQNTSFGTLFGDVISQNTAADAGHDDIGY